MLKKFLTLVISVLIFHGLSLAAKVDTLNIFSKSMQKDIKCVVVLPDSYSGNTVYPVVYLLHGYGGNYASWLIIAPQIKNWADENKVLIVCPDGATSWYFNSPLDASIRYETFVATEVPAFIDSKYKTVNNRNGRAITGLSMGGHGALYLAIRHKDFFGAAGSTSGGVDFTPFPENWEIKKSLGEYKAHPDLWNENTVIHQVDNLENGNLKIIVDCGVDDFFLQVNRDLNQKLLEKKIDHDYIERPGGHTLEYWNNSIDFQLLFFKKYFQSNKLL